MKGIFFTIFGIFCFFMSLNAQHKPGQHPPTGEQFIKMLDRNGDGRVSKDEFRGPSNHFNQFDRNNDGYISSDEAPTGPPGMGNDNRGQGFGNQSKGGASGGQLMDVHGAGAQRSDPKSGSKSEYASGHGPQGDVVRIKNAVRCVRGGLKNGKNVPYVIVDTGQTICYDNGSRGKLWSCPKPGADYHGQDGNYQGISPSYTDNGDGTITDKNTDLVWQKSFSKSKWAEAPSKAKSLNLGGHNDWRVPSIKELYSLMKFDGATGTANPSSSKKPSDAIPYLDTDYFHFEYPTEGRYIDAQYITSTAYVSDVMNGQKAFFGVNFADGRIKGYPQAGNPQRQEFYVRFVRGNPSYGKNNFRNNGDGTIDDKATGLTWMQADFNGLNWKDALKACENLTLSGKNDWRLPNAKELHSIVDYSRSPDTTRSAAINSLFSVTPIKDEGGQQDYPFYWTSTTHHDGRVEGKWAVYVAFGEAKGFMGGNSQGQQQRKGSPKRKPRW